VKPEAANSVIAKDHLTGLKQGLADLNYVDNQNIVLEVRDVKRSECMAAAC
jgi:hypothetical protein